MKNIGPALAALGAIGVFALVMIGWKLVLPLFSAKALARTPQGLAKVAAQANKDLPKMVDNETRLVRIDSTGLTLVYHYEMPNVSASGLDLPVFHETLLPQVRSKTCAQQEVRSMFLDNGDTLRYEYVDRDGVRLTSFDLTQEDCTKLGM